MSVGLFFCILLAIHLQLNKGQPSLRHDLNYGSGGGIFIPVGLFNNLLTLKTYSYRRDVASKRSDVLPGSINDIKPSHEYSAGVNCILSTKNVNNAVTLEVKECEEKLPLAYFIKKFYHGVDISQVSLGFIQSEKLIFKELTISDTSVEFQAESNGETYNHAQSMLHLKDASLKKLKLPRVISSETQVDGMVFELEGMVNEFKTSISSHSGTKFVKIDMTGNAISLDSLLSIWGLSLNNMISNDIGFSLSKFKDVKVNEPSVTGVYDANGDFQLLAKFSANDQGAFTNGATAYFVINKSAGSPVDGALLMEYKTNVQIIEQLKAFIKYDYSDPEIFGNVIKPWVLSASSAMFNLINFPDFVKLFNDVVVKSVEAGINVYLQVDIKKSLADCDPTSEVVDKSIPDGGILLHMSLLVSGIRTEFPSTFSADLPAMMKCVSKGTTVQLPNLLFPKGFRPPFDIKEIDINPEARTFRLSVLYPQVIKLFGPLSISNPSITVSKDGLDSPWVFEGHSEVNFGPDISGSVDLSFDTVKNFKVTIKVAFIDIESFAKAFGANPFAGNEGIKDYLNVGIKDFYVEIATTFKKAGSTEVTISGIPVINSLPTVTLAGYIWTPDDPTITTSTPGIAFGLVIQKQRLDVVFKKLTGIDMTAAWLGDASIVLLVSNAHKNYCTNPKNKDLKQCKEDAEETDENNNAEVESSSNKIRKSHFENNLKKSQIVRSTIDTSEEETNEAEAANDKVEKVTTPKTHFEAISELSDIEIKKGLVIRATLQLPDDCLKDAICEFLNEKIGARAKLVLEGQFTTQTVKITASLEVNIELSANVMLKELSLSLEIGTENKIEIKCQFHVKDPSLVIAGSIGIDLSGKLEIGGTVSGMIERPFNIEWLAIGNLLLKIGLDLKTALPSIEIGAAIYIGRAPAEGQPNDRFQFEGYLGLDPTDPTNNYFYARSFGKDLTIENVLKQLGFNTDYLPKLVRESGFYGELMISLNLGLSEKEIPEFGILIPPGFAFKGKLNILSYSIECEVKFDFKAGTFYIDANFDPINDWGYGLIKVYRSTEDREKGPKFTLNLDLSSKKFDVYIEGLISILGMERYLKIEITSEKFLFIITGDIWGVLKAQLNVEAKYNGQYLESFAFKGCLQFDLQQISESIKKSLLSAKEKASAALASAREHVTQSKAVVTRAFDKVRGWKNDIEGYKQRLRARSQELEEQKNALGQSCTKECGEVCIPFFGWQSNCYTIWGVSYGCLTWDNCKWKAPNLLCIAGCEIRKGFSKFVAWAEQIGIKIMLGLSEIGQSLLDATSFIENIAQGILDAANKVLLFAEKATQAILDLPAKLVEAAASFITIHQFCVYGTVDPKVHACLGMNYDVSIFSTNHKYDGTICLNLNIYESLGSNAAKKHVPEIEDLDSKTASINAEVADLDVSSKNVDSESSRVQGEVNSKTTSSIEKRATVPTEEELYFHKLAFNPLPRVNLRSQETINFLKNATPWEYHKFEEFETYNQEAVRRSKVAAASKHGKIPNEESHSTCEQQKNVLSRYQTMADGFHSALKYINSAKEAYLSQKKSYLNHINYIDELIHKGSLHNMTQEERQDILYWRDGAEKYAKSYVEKAERIFKEQKREGIYHFRQLFNDIVEKERGVKLPQYIKYLHSLAVNANRKSEIGQGIPTDSWHHLQKMLLVLATSERIQPHEVAKQVNYVNKMLTTIKRSSVPCAA